MAKCLICATSIEPFLSFGPMPIANGFLTADEFDREHFFDLCVGYCHACHMVQLTERIEPEKLFHSNYAYFSSVSARMTRHFQSFAAMVRERYLAASDPFVVEIGSNDGILLHNFTQAGVRHLGVEPSANVAEAARAKGVQTICRFFNEDTAHTIRREHGLADVLLGANVICHIPDLHGLLRGAQVLLKDSGVFIFEEPYLGDIVEKTSYDQIYDEHIFYFSLHGLDSLFADHGLEIVAIEPQPVHGGSMRYVVARQGRHPIDPAVHAQRVKERELGLNDARTFEQLRDRIKRSRADLLDLLRALKQQGRCIVGYGATSKSTTVTNFCGIGTDLLDYVSDTTPGKQGRYTPGVHIPVVSYERFKESYPDYALLFAWNHAEEILAKEQDFLQQGGKFIVYVPSVQVLREELVSEVIR